MWMSLSVILYPFSPPVSARDSESRMNGSTLGISISGIPECRKHTFRFHGIFAYKCLIYNVVCRRKIKVIYFINFLELSLAALIGGGT